MIHKFDMEIEFKNFANAGSGTVRINDLTIICGRNNSGMTHINHAVYSIISEFQKSFDIGLDQKELEQASKGLSSKEGSMLDITKTMNNIDNHIRKAKQQVVSNFEKHLGFPDNHFPGLEISINLDEKNLNNSMKYELAEEIGFDICCLNDKESNRYSLVLLNVDDYDELFDNLESNEKKCEIIKKFTNLAVLSSIFEGFPTPFPITSERTGILSFHNLFDNKNTIFVEEIGKVENSEDNSSTIKKNRSNYTLPILENISAVKNYDDKISNESVFFKNLVTNRELFEILDKLLDNGKFKQESGVLNFVPKNVDGKAVPVTPLQASSSVKTLFLLDLFVKHIAKDVYNMLIIDEPELNLDPVNQTLMARILARLVNSGIKVMLTTHSDYFIREINNLIALSNANEHKEEIMEKYDIKNEEILEKNQVSAYQTTTDGVIEMRITNYGIDTKVLDSIISRENLKADEIADIVVDDE